MPTDSLMRNCLPPSASLWVAICPSVSSSEALGPEVVCAGDGRVPHPPAMPAASPSHP